MREEVITPAERQAMRRAALIEAAIEVFGTEGYASSSVRGICSLAGVNQRFFYESFGGREDLLLAVFEQIAGEVLGAVAGAVMSAQTMGDRLRAGLTAFWRAAEFDRRRARIAMIESVGVSEAIELRRREVRHGFAAFLVAQAEELVGPPDPAARLQPEIVARMLQAATFEMVVDWLRGDTELNADELVEQTMTLFMLAAEHLYPGRIASA